MTEICPGIHLKKKPNDNYTECGWALRRFGNEEKTNDVKKVTCKECLEETAKK